MSDLSAGLIPEHLLIEVEHLLAPDNPLSRDIRDLAGMLNFRMDEISYICTKRAPFRYMLDQWTKRDPNNSTFEHLKKCLVKLKRPDVLELIDQAISEINESSFDKLQELLALQNQRLDRANVSGFINLNSTAQQRIESVPAETSVQDSNEKKISVFIIYYPESDEYLSDVEKLAQYLHSNDIEVKMDLFDSIAHAQSKQLYVLKNIRSCDHVIISCSRAVKMMDKLTLKNDQITTGTDKMDELLFVMRQILNDLYISISSKKYIPVLLPGQTTKNVPKLLQSKKCYRYPDTSDSELLRRLYAVESFSLEYKKDKMKPDFL